jgi:hypothetical protein
MRSLLKWYAENIESEILTNKEVSQTVSTDDVRSLLNDVRKSMDSVPIQDIGNSSKTGESNMRPATLFKNAEPLPKSHVSVSKPNSNGWMHCIFQPCNEACKVMVDVSSSQTIGAFEILAADYEILNRKPMLKKIIPLPNSKLDTQNCNSEITTTVSALESVMDWSVLLKKNSPDKLLKRPPVRFMFDLVKTVCEKTGLLLFEKDDMKSWDFVSQSKENKNEFFRQVLFNSCCNHVIVENLFSCLMSKSTRLLRVFLHISECPLLSMLIRSCLVRTQGLSMYSCST